MALLKYEEQHEDEQYYSPINHWLLGKIYQSRSWILPQFG